MELGSDAIRADRAPIAGSSRAAIRAQSRLPINSLGTFAIESNTFRGVYLSMALPSGHS